MPTVNAHRLAAKSNQQVIDYLLPQIAVHSEWIAIAAFYKALHVIEVLFHEDRQSPRKGGCVDHDDRTAALMSSNRYKHIFINFDAMKKASTVARYLEVRGHAYSSFSAYMAPQVVESKILKHYLVQVESSITGLLGKPPI
jgi:hypothetical protein